MRSPISMLERAIGALPDWVAWPLSAASLLAALSGSVLVFLAAAYGSVAMAIWGVGSFGAGAILWYGADMAQVDRRR